jgi:ATP-dependent helicase/nuclease subunit A
MASVLDQFARDRATTVTDRNIVVTAGAGTGKTTLLVERLIHLLLHRDPPLSLNEIVALTFTNKAATEMKMRLRTRLIELGDQEAARGALVQLEQSQIGTIHSFAAHLLRLYPVEGAVDPSFQQDEGLQFEEQFQRDWRAWLDRELGSDGRHHDAWRRILGSLSLDDLGILAKSLCGELIPLDDVTKSHGPLSPPAVRQWLMESADRAEQLVEAHEKRTMIDSLLGQAAALFRRAAAHGFHAVTEDSTFACLDRSAPGQTSSWTAEEHRRAKHLLNIARDCFVSKESPLQAALDRVVPFAASFRRSFVATGYVSFDGLLARCRDMLRDHPHVRRQLKSRFRSMLVDEFQDTDPVQYELILYLAEAEGREARDWREVRLEPGKLFIVGDPKQSIYAFRRADIEAYDRVVQDHVLGRDPRGESYKLQVNFRSHGRLLRTVNEFFRGIFPAVPEVGLQPQHDPLMPFLPEEPPLEQERVECRIAIAADEERDAEASTKAEAEELARWLAKEVIGVQHIRDRGAVVSVQPRHIAVLFRTLVPLRDYVEAFRRYAIPCQAEGERHFYERQEVVDTIHILSAAADPHDRLALVGVLRSVAGGLADADIAVLANAGLLDYRIRHPGLNPEESASQAFDKARPVYEVLSALHQDLPRLPIPDIVPAVFARVPLIELAAASLDRDQAIGNLVKLQDLAAELADRPAMTFTRLARELTRRITEVPQEAEMSMAEEEHSGEPHAGFMRLLSMHKAKGLEFPVVILAGLHRVPIRQNDAISVHHDWSTGITGVRAGAFCTSGGLYTTAKLAERRWAEHSRLLYVGMTRAKRKLVLSAGLPATLQTDSFLSCIATRLDLDLRQGESLEPDQELRCGEEAISLSVRKENEHPEQQVAGGRFPEWKTIDELDGTQEATWRERRRRWAESASRPLFLTATMVHDDQSHDFSVGRRSDRADREASQQFGTVVHRILERWDFNSPPSDFKDHLDGIVREQLIGVPEARRQPVYEHLVLMFGRFVSLPVYRDLQRATILGREMPFLMPWKCQGQTMSGTIDLLYRLDGQLWIADYKTDAVEAKHVRDRLDRYRQQAEIYTAAIARALGVDAPSFQFIFLRPGVVATL